MTTVLALYQSAIEVTTTRRHAGDPDHALHAFLTLNAAYFLGPWLPQAVHRRLIARLVADLDGIADVPVPTDPAHAAQLAQHGRELAAELGPTAWTARVVDATSFLVPADEEDWAANVRAAARLVADGADGHPLLLAHARRRLWELGGGTTVPSAGPMFDVARMRRAARAAVEVGGHALQVAEAALAEIDGEPALAPKLLPILGRGLCAPAPARAQDDHPEPEADQGAHRGGGT